MACIWGGSASPVRRNCRFVRRAAVRCQPPCAHLWERPVREGAAQRPQCLPQAENRAASRPFATRPSYNGRASLCSIQCFTLDLIAPDVALGYTQAAEAIERLRAQGPVLVCCALGYSRSASAVAAWLLLSGRCSDAQQAEALIRKARPGIVLHPAHRRPLQRLGAQP